MKLTAESPFDLKSLNKFRETVFHIGDLGAICFINPVATGAQEARSERRGGRGPEPASYMRRGWGAGGSARLQLPRLGHLPLRSDWPAASSPEPPAEATPPPTTQKKKILGEPEGVGGQQNKYF